VRLARLVAPACIPTVARRLSFRVIAPSISAFETLYCRTRRFSLLGVEISTILPDPKSVLTVLQSCVSAMTDVADRNSGGASTALTSASSGNNGRQLEVREPRQNRTSTSYASHIYFGVAGERQGVFEPRIHTQHALALLVGQASGSILRHANGTMRKFFTDRCLGLHCCNYATLDCPVSNTCLDLQ
jgi:hypothetical protein